MQFQYFQIYRSNTNHLTVRAGSTNHASGGTIHLVTGGFYHGNYSTNIMDYNVAVLRVCADCDIAIDISDFVMFLQ
jgi:hypothetical protein